MSRQLEDWLTTYLQYTSRSEASPLFNTWCGLSILASAIGRRIFFDWDRLLFPNMYILLIGPAGRARKGTALGPASDLMDAAGIPCCSSSTTPEGFLQQFYETSHYIDGMPPRYDTNKISEMTIFSSDFQVFMKKTYEAMMSDLTDLFDFSRPVWSYKPKLAEPAIIPGPCLNICTATTPEDLVAILPNRAIFGGFMSRFMAVYSDEERVVHCPRKTDEERQLRGVLLGELQHIQEVKGEVRETPEWFARYSAWRDEWKGKLRFSDPKLAGYSARRPTHFIKLCMLIALSQSDDLVLTEQVYERALHLLSITERMMPRMYWGFGRNPVAELVPRIIGIIVQHGEISTSSLYSKIMADCSVDEFDVIMNKMLTRIKPVAPFVLENRGSSARPDIWCRLNPEWDKREEVAI